MSVGEVFKQLQELQREVAAKNGPVVAPVTIPATPTLMHVRGDDGESSNVSEESQLDESDGNELTLTVPSKTKKRIVKVTS